MKDADWNDCIHSFSSRKITPDKNRAHSLRETAAERIAVIGKITSKNCNFVFEDYYTSLLEMLQAMTFIEGFNVLNHLCLGFYIRDVLRRDDLYKIFDDLRYKRNSLTYYGNRMDFATAKKAIEKCKKVMAEIDFGDSRM